MAWVYVVSQHKFYRINKERQTICSLKAGVGEAEINRLNKVLNGIAPPGYDAKLAKKMDLFGKFVNCISNDSYRELGTQPALYAGAPGYKDDPDKESIKDSGPLPRGVYLMTDMRDNRRWDENQRKWVGTGRDTIFLKEHPTNSMHRRSLFRIHGDNESGNASSGCIVANQTVRRAIWNSGDRILIVIGYGLQNSSDKEIINRGFEIRWR